MPPLLVNILSDNRLVPLAVALIAVVFLMSSMRRHQRRQAERAAAPLPAQRPPPAVGQIHRDLDELMVELQELSRRISAEIDTRFVKLEAAMRDADRRIAVLNRLTRQLGERMAAESNGAAGQDARHAIIYELADAGFTPVEIAKDLGRTPGEVELILNLRRKET